MTGQGTLYLGALEDKLQRLPFALSLSDVSRADDPLVFVNAAFTEMTGYGAEVLGRNCRFLQDDLPNEAARAEVREALRSGRRTQVVLHNRRKSGETFYNLLLLERLAPNADGVTLAVGSQFDLGAVDPERDLIAGDDPIEDRLARITDQAGAIKIERRRVVADAAVRLIQSWNVINDVLARLD